VDAGDYVVVSDALNVKLTGKKAQDKKYFFHSGWPGGEKWIPITRLRETKPDDVSQSLGLLASKLIIPPDRSFEGPFRECCQRTSLEIGDWRD
jgi:hypothetical protein